MIWMRDWLELRLQIRQRWLVIGWCWNPLYSNVLVLKGCTANLLTKRFRKERKKNQMMDTSNSQTTKEKRLTFINSFCNQQHTNCFSMFPTQTLSNTGWAAVFQCPGFQLQITTAAITTFDTSCALQVSSSPTCQVTSTSPLQGCKGWEKTHTGWDMVGHIFNQQLHSYMNNLVIQHTSTRCSVSPSNAPPHQYVFGSVMY